MKIEPWCLGATLYVPSTHAHLEEILQGKRLTEAHSLVICLEDAIREDEVAQGLANLKQALEKSLPSPQLRFVRPRNPKVLKQVLDMSGVEVLTGFVLPKITVKRWGHYWETLAPLSQFLLMPTLETAEAFDEQHMITLRDQMVAVRERILSLRIGDNDLLRELGMRRPRHHTLYHTPIGPAICRLVQMFKPAGFSLAAPVCEFLDRMDILEMEVSDDLRHGLVGKAAIHPSQIRTIEAAYRVHRKDFEAATAILDVASPAVFRMDGAMCEPATHDRWARQILTRHQLYGVAA